MDEKGANSKNQKYVDHRGRGGKKYLTIEDCREGPVAAPCNVLLTKMPFERTPAGPMHT